MKNIKQMKLKELKSLEVMEVNGGSPAHYGIDTDSWLWSVAKVGNAIKNAFDSVHGFYDALWGMDSHKV
ncbi:hypothetical protein F7018_01620 [Tenacibaculum aiptasiae]|uniref:Uncharacterized protein n=1 Tax=Tenacibaculum aiptasiae TaxID=426481 RepID=A0A7J5AUG5_9FLAO|nr:hypothetical protein [Tenacibaculum aiptasiae]KAB1160600.1 hypothetical protein F7018_01620 [Tenacibaculum aiptasiae]